MIRQQFSSALGWFGVVCILAAYGANVAGISTATSWWYLLLNAVGSIALVIETATKRDRQPMVLNIIWAIIAILGLLGFVIGRS